MPFLPTNQQHQSTEGTIYSTEPTTKKWRTGRLTSKNGYAQKYQYTVWGIHGVSPEEEKVGYGG